MSQLAAAPGVYYLNVRDQAVFDPDGPHPQFLADGEKLKVLVVGLEPGQQIPAHPEALAVYHFLAGEGVMSVDGQTYAVTAGTTVIAPQGAARGMRAASRLVFLAAKAGV